MSVKLQAPRTHHSQLCTSCLQANEDASVICYPLSKRGDKLCHMKTTCIFWSRAKLVQTLVLSLMNTGTSYPHRPRLQQTAYISVHLQGEANEMLGTQDSRLGLAHRSPVNGHCCHHPPTLQVIPRWSRPCYENTARQDVFSKCNENVQMFPKSCKVTQGHVLSPLQGNRNEEVPLVLLLQHWGRVAWMLPSSSKIVSDNQTQNVKTKMMSKDQRRKNPPSFFISRLWYAKGTLK